MEVNSIDKEIKWNLRYNAYNYCQKMHTDNSVVVDTIFSGEFWRVYSAIKEKVKSEHKKFSSTNN